MKSDVAVVTVSGKAYYLIIRELKKRNVPFLSLTPSEEIPIDIKVVLTTEEERPLLKHEKILVLKNKMEPEALVKEVLQAIHGRGCCRKIVIGVDPGEVFGLAILVDGDIVETENCFSTEETLNKIETFLGTLKSNSSTYISVKIGDGVAEYKENLLRALDRRLPSSIVLQSVREEGTNRFIGKVKHRRGLRDIVSAVKIAGRNGYTFARRKSDESNS